MKSKVSNEIITAASPTVAASAPAQHSVIVITELTPLAFAAATVLTRSGWMVSPDAAPAIYASTNHATITLVRGNPSAEAVAVAEAAESYAAAKHQVDYQAEIDAAAKRMLAQNAKDAADATRAAFIAAHKAELAGLEAAQARELATALSSQ